MSLRKTTPAARSLADSAATSSTIKWMRFHPVGVAERLVSEGAQATRFTIHDRDRVLMTIGFADLPTRYPYTLMVSQAVTEATLLQRFTTSAAPSTDRSGSPGWPRGRSPSRPPSTTAPG